MKTTYRIAATCLTTVLLALLLTGCDATAPTLKNDGQHHQPVVSSLFFEQVQNIQKPGLSTQLLQADAESDVDVLLIVLDANAYDPYLVAAPGKGVSVQTAMNEQSLEVIIGSGFVSELHSLEPVGLLQFEGSILSAVQRHGYTRILGINDSGLGVVHRKNYQRGIFHSALQTGPGIVENGKLDISVRDLQRPKYYRSFIAVCEANWVLGVSLQPMNLRPIGERLLAFFATSNMVCDDVVNLAGDREAVIAIRHADQPLLFHGDPETYKVSMLGFREK
ncbi:MAG: phosphodiester glycosidase family protein [Gammaproteobacteria bacterium]|nr:phosphodiester glycosidase family protein [Gammaproteobacteria bacterium]